MKKDETLIQDEIIAYLKQNRILHWRMSGASNLSGFPDLLVCYDGWFVGLEVKTSVGAPTMQQRKTIQDIIEARGVAGLVTSVDDVKAVIEGLKNGGESWWKHVFKPSN